MFIRTLAQPLKEFATKYPSLAILGPRQSGKSTLSKNVFPDYAYLSFEDRSIRERAALDPKGFLESYNQAPGLIFDEFQRQPEILSYIQLAIDNKYQPGRFILTGSQNFLMNEKISQSLAGRVAILTLMPLSIAELAGNKLLQNSIEDVLFTGGYPRIYDQKLNPVIWYSDYIETYVEKDIKQLTNIADLELFRKFVALCAGRVGQTLDLTSLSNDCGISVPTVRRWLSLLQSSYIIFLLQPYYKNFGKRKTKSPKLYFYDTGLACSFLNIEKPAQLANHYLRGGLFESFIISEIIKFLYNTGRRPKIYFWQEAGRTEIDCIIEKADEFIAIEIKASATSSKDFFKGLEIWNQIAQCDSKNNFVVYTGKETERWPGGMFINWQQLPDMLEKQFGKLVI